MEGFVAVMLSIVIADHIGATVLVLSQVYFHIDFQINAILRR